MKNNTSQIRCEDEPTLQRLLDEELDPDANELVFHHLKGCGSCSTVFQELRELKSFSEGQLGFEDESEAVYSYAVLSRVRATIKTTQGVPGTTRTAAPLGNGKGQHDGLQNQPALTASVAGREMPGTSWLQSLGARLKVTGQTIWMRPGAVTTVVVVLLASVGLILWLRTPTNVSAAELLRRSISAEDAINSHPDQVLRRTINLEARVEQAASLSDTGNAFSRRRIEVWHSAEKGLTARRLFDEKDRLVSGEWKRADGSRIVYREGGQPQLQPAPEKQPGELLSPESIWLVDVSAKDFSSLIGNVDGAHVVESAGTYVISYEAQPGSNNSLIKATLVLSKADLHTIEQTLLIRLSTDLQSEIGKSQFISYRFAETSFERRTPGTVAPAVFEPDPSVLATNEKSKNQSRETKDPEAPSSSSPLTPAPLAASAELEVEVLEKLNRVNAFLGEQLSLTRTPEGRLLVSGMVETSERKNEILRSLGEIAKNPAVRIDVSTVAEAQKRQQSARTGNLTVQDVQVSENTIPVDAELRSYLSRKGLSGEQLEHEIEQLSRRVLAHSTRARSHALALKQIAERFSPANLETMDKSALIRWRALIKEHAQFFRREFEQVRQELSPVFPAASGSGSSADMEIASDKEIARAAKSLFELASVTDNGLRRSLSLSSERASDAPVRSPQFWHSFASAESLASRISDLRF